MSADNVIDVWERLQRDAIEPEAPPETVESEGESTESVARTRPRVILVDDPLHEVVDQAIAALAESALAPVLNGNALSRVVETDVGPKLDAYAPETFQVLLSRAIVWEREDNRSDPPRFKRVDPPMGVTRAVLALAEGPFPRVNRVVTAPMYGRDGSLPTKPGPHEASRTLYLPGPEMQALGDLTRQVTQEDLLRAKSLILGDLLCDFPFEKSGDRAGALSLKLTAYVRELIDGPTPNHVADAPGPGAGKGKLVDSCLAGPFGRVAKNPQHTKEEELRKALTSIFLSAPAVTLLDNWKGFIGSPSLELALTEELWEDRRLTVSQHVRLPIRCLWAMTTNNATLSPDLDRRSIHIRLVPNVERPYDRPSSDFKHRLPKWAHEHRAELVEAAHILIRWWVQQGSPRWDGNLLGSYEEYSEIVGGILMCAGLEDGFLSRSEDLSTEHSDAVAFFMAWERDFGMHQGLTQAHLASEWKSAREVAQRILGDKILGQKNGALTVAKPSYLDGTRDDELAKRIGHYLSSRKDGVFGGLKLQRGPRGETGYRWRVVRVASPPADFDSEPCLECGAPADLAIESDGQGYWLCEAHAPDQEGT